MKKVNTVHSVFDSEFLIEKPQFSVLVEVKNELKGEKLPPLVKKYLPRIFERS